MRPAIYDVMRFWLARGVDGFRVDVIWHLIKDAEFRDNPPNPHFREGRPPHEKILTRYSTDQPEVHEVIAEMRRVVDEFDDRVLIGEIYLPLHRLVAYYGNDLGGAHLPFNFALLSTLWSARSIERIIADYEAALPPGAWPNWVLGNHDRPRVASRVGTGAGACRRDAVADLAGNADALLRRRNRHAPGRDSRPTRSAIPSRRTCRGSASAGTAAARRCNGMRLAHAGFSRTTPWLPLPDDFVHENVVNLAADAKSILSLYKALISLRKKLPQLRSGDYVPIAAEGDLLLYRRQSAEGALVIALNLGDRAGFDRLGCRGVRRRNPASTFLDREGEKG